MKSTTWVSLSPALSRSRPRDLPRPALHGVPEPVDRRFRGAAGARFAPAGARAAQGRRQRYPGGRFHGGALWRVRLAEAPHELAYGNPVGGAVDDIDRR